MPWAARRREQFDSPASIAEAARAIDGDDAPDALLRYVHDVGRRRPRDGEDAGTLTAEGTTS
jgi:hypothetical protein